MIYGEPEASRFIEALQRIKRLRQRKEKQTKTAKQKLRAALRKGR
ncbi:MAG: hypothetical protein U0746_09075 [Gemmataceae bacterium]